MTADIYIRHCTTGPLPWPTAAAVAAGALDPTLLAAPVLIVEDEAMIAWTVESLLEEMGFTAIAIAASGEDAIAAAQACPPRLVVSDINLGPARMDGVEAACRVCGGTTALVFVSGHVDEAARARIGRELPRAVIAAKPVGPDQLRGAIVQATALPPVQ